MQDTQFLIGAVCFLCGLILRGSINEMRIRKECSRAEAEGFSRCLLLLSPQTQQTPVDRKLRIVK